MKEEPGLVMIRATPEYMALSFKEGFAWEVVEGINDNYEFAGFSWNDIRMSFIAYFRHKKNYREGMEAIEITPTAKRINKNVISSTG